MNFEKDYVVPFFTEYDFIRKKCKHCESFFWTQNKDKTNCGDAPCQLYTFLKNPPTKKSLTLNEVREAFLLFFENNGHKRIKPYPIVARWRDDLFVTIASIAAFQPFVTEGIIPPPANPLVISQPCLRFNDLDNVGLTAGRHYTIFEMGGAHAFNYPKKPVYWNDKTIRFHHEFVTNILGVKSEEVTYKESFWAGGGNAGPCVEASIRGLEVSTLVFMKYKVTDNKFSDMPIKIVDTGYGIERFTWLSQGTVSGFHAVYGVILDKILDFAGLTRVDEEILLKSTRYSALIGLDHTANKRTLRRRVADSIGMDTMELERLLSPIESIYSVADHTKALAFMLAEGVVPSNVKIGYLARLLIRRTYRLLRLLGIAEQLGEIVDLQIDFWSKDFPKLKDVRSEILEALDIEGRKYKDTLNRGVGFVRKIVKDLKAQRKDRIPIETLVQFYDSHGIPPEIVGETAILEGMKFKMPYNFYAKIAEKHVFVAPNKEEAVTFKEKISKYPTTKPLYYEDVYCTYFEAEVLAVIEDKYVILNKTAFYPRGGGQEPDTGFLEKNGQQIAVVDVQKIGKVIIHKLKKRGFKKEDKIIGRIDWTTRLDLMRHHTSTHILLGAVRKVLGEHAWQAGVQKDAKKARLDISHWKRISFQQLRNIEALANSIVIKNMPVEVFWMPREKAEKLYGYRIYEGGVVPGSTIRVVKIGDWDVEACGGLHLRATGEVGLIKIINSERIQDGVERIIFTSGLKALQLIQALEKTLRDASNLLNVSPENIAKEIKKIMRGRKEREKEIEHLKDQTAEYKSVELLEKAETIQGIQFVTFGTKTTDTNFLIKIGNSITTKEPKTVVVMYTVNERVNLVVMAGNEAVSSGINAGVIASEMAKVVGGGGGGRPSFGQGGGTLVKKVTETIDVAKKTVQRLALWR